MEELLNGLCDQRPKRRLEVATLIMASMYSKPGDVRDIDHNLYARHAVEAADALLRALGEGGKEQADGKEKGSGNG